MGKPTGFKEFDRKKVPWRLPVVQVNDYDEITEPRVEHLQDQGLQHGLWRAVLSICDWMPHRQLDSEWNDLVYNNRWKEANERLTRPIIFRVYRATHPAL